MKTRKPSLTSLVAFFLIVTPLVYVLSYAPVVRTGQVICGRSTVYRPVDWLIDNTPLRNPLFIWAGLFGVRRDFEIAGVRRMIEPSIRWERH